MLLPVSTVAAICIVFDITENVVSSDNELENIFRQRSRSEWEDVWHREKYTRCRETLLQHLYWACEKDIYRLTRRSSNNFKHFRKIEEYEDLPYPLISPREALQLIRTRRGAGRRSSSITAECCSSSGCTWEEYAEYCPTNKRHIAFI